MSKRLGKISAIVGAALLLVALLLVLRSNQSASQASVAVEGALTSLEDVMGEDWSEDAAAGTGSTLYKVPTSGNMSAVEIDDTLWLGALTLPSLELELPVASTTDDMDTSPGRLSGSVWSNDLVIQGLNYDSHFGGLDLLVAGDAVYLTDVNGYTFCYEVVEALELVDESTVGELAERFDLVLLTRTSDGTGYFYVGCNRTTA